MMGALKQAEVLSSQRHSGLKVLGRAGTFAADGFLPQAQRLFPTKSGRITAKNNMKLLGAWYQGQR